MRIAKDTLLEELLPYIGSLDPCEAATFELCKYAELTVKEAWQAWSFDHWMLWLMSEIRSQWFAETPLGNHQTKDAWVFDAWGLRVKMSGQRSMSAVRRRVKLAWVMNVLTQWTDWLDGLSVV